MRFLFLLPLVFIALYARENPFIATNNQTKNPFNAIPLIQFDSTKKSDIKIAPIVKKEPTRQVVTKKISLFPIIEKKEAPTKSSQTLAKIITSPLQSVAVDNKPVLLSELDPDTIIGCCNTSSKKVFKHKRRKKVHKKRRRKNISTILFQNCFLKIVRQNSQIKIYTDDPLSQKLTLKDPKRLVLDFKRLQYFKTKSRSIPSHNAKRVNIGSHHCFYRIAFTLAKNIKFKKTNYGYLIY